MARSRAAAKPNIVVIWGDDIGMYEPELLQRRG